MTKKKEWRGVTGASLFPRNSLRCLISFFILILWILILCTQKIHICILLKGSNKFAKVKQSDMIIILTEPSSVYTHVHKAEFLQLNQLPASWKCKFEVSIKNGKDNLPPKIQKVVFWIFYYKSSGFFIFILFFCSSKYLGGKKGENQRYHLKR